MPLVNAKCTNCGANLQVDNTNDAAICQYCGSAYIVEKAVNNYNYNTINNIQANVVNICGSDSADFVIRAGVLEKYNGTSTEVLIPEGVRQIGSNAFSGLGGLERVAIPSSVTHISSSAFAQCINLEEITIPDSVISIGVKAFWGCSGLRRVTIPSSVTTLHSGAFSFCTNLEEINIHYGLTYIGPGVFSYCSKLREIIIPGSMTEIGRSAFERCNGLLTIIIPNSVTVISERAFYCCEALQNVVLSKNLVKISNEAFAFCSNLTSITIPTGTKIEDPGGDSDSISNGAFFRCDKLMNVITESDQIELPENAFHNTPWRARYHLDVKRKRQNAGVCDLCGGTFKGLIFKKCTTCGTDKRY